MTFPPAIASFVSDSAQFAAIDDAERRRDDSVVHDLRSDHRGDDKRHDGTHDRHNGSNDPPQVPSTQDPNDQSEDRGEQRPKVQYSAQHLGIARGLGKEPSIVVVDPFLRVLPSEFVDPIDPLALRAIGFGDVVERVGHPFKVIPIDPCFPAASHMHIPTGRARERLIMQSDLRGSRGGGGDRNRPCGLLRSGRKRRWTRRGFGPFGLNDELPRTTWTDHVLTDKIGSDIQNSLTLLAFDTGHVTIPQMTVGSLSRASNLLLAMGVAWVCAQILTIHVHLATNPTKSSVQCAFESDKSEPSRDNKVGNYCKIVTIE